MDSQGGTGVSSGLEEVIRLEESLDVDPLLYSPVTGQPVDELLDEKIMDKCQGDHCSPGFLQPRTSSTPLQLSAVSEKLDQMLLVQPTVDSDLDNVSLRLLQAQSQERMVRQRLHAYQDAQQRQAHIVQKLQAKVLQYKQRCKELEGQILGKTTESEKMRLMLQVYQDEAPCQRKTQQDFNMDDKSAQLEEEQRKCTSLSQVNSLLREQLEQANTVNQGLTESLWTAHEEIKLCDKHLSREQEAHSSWLSCEQAHVRSVWRQATSLRSAFNQLRTFTDRTLSSMRGECATGTQQIVLAFASLQSRAGEESNTNGLEVSALERQLREKLKEAMQFQGRWDAEKVELESRTLELTDTVKNLRRQSSEKDASIDTMRISLDKLVGPGELAVGCGR